MKMAIGRSQMKKTTMATPKSKKKLTDLTGDGKITYADVLEGRGVNKARKGGVMRMSKGKAVMKMAKGKAVMKLSGGKKVKGGSVMKMAKGKAVMKMAKGKAVKKPKK